MAERAWSVPFLAMLESLRMPTQFQQGRRYARRGQVRQLSVSSGLVTGLVFDDDGQTYRAMIAIRSFTGTEWAQVERAMVAEAGFAAALLTGQVPDNLDQIFDGVGLSLFPEGLGEVALDCTCGVWHKPCRHLTASCYVLAESFDRDPFAILAWRGRGRDELLDRLRALRTSAARLIEEAGPRSSPADFWVGGPRVAPVAPSVPAGRRRPGSVLDQLEPLGLRLNGDDVVARLRSLYRRLSG